MKHKLFISLFIGCLPLFSIMAQLKIDATGQATFGNQTDIAAANAAQAIDSTMYQVRSHAKYTSEALKYGIYASVEKYNPTSNNVGSVAIYGLAKTSSGAAIRNIGDTRISFYTGIEDFDSLFIKSCVAAFEPYSQIEGDGVEDLSPLYKCVVHNDYPNLGEQLKETYSHVIPYIKLLHTDTIWLTGVEPILKPKTLIHQTINGLYIEKGINDIADVFILIHKVAKFFLQQQRIIKLI